MKIFLMLCLSLVVFITGQADILIPMDLVQTDHLKAYGVAWQILNMGQDIEWLLNYRGGSFLTKDNPQAEDLLYVKGVYFRKISQSEVMSIKGIIAESNMEAVLLEKAPEVAVYTAPSQRPWDDAVTLVLEYSEIPYDKVFDEEVLRGKLNDYDWVHLFHEDFTGQYGKFYASSRNTQWYKDQQKEYMAMAHRLGFQKVWQLKHEVALKMRAYIEQGGFLFAMCAATDSYDIALNYYDVDICEAMYDGDGMDPNYRDKVDWSRSIAFENYKLVTDPLVYEYSNIDVSNYRSNRTAEQDYFTLFEFSAKYDPVPTMLTQCHTNYIKGFYGQTTGFLAETIKKNIVIMGKTSDKEVKYIHGDLGKGHFTFYGGHDPEDYRHLLGDPPTNLYLHKNSPGYRLILNNILFPAAKEKKRKT